MHGHLESVLEEIRLGIDGAQAVDEAQDVIDRVEGMR